jgi:hypothetical protein
MVLGRGASMMVISGNYQDLAGFCLVSRRISARADLDVLMGLRLPV